MATTGYGIVEKQLKAWWSCVFFKKKKTSCGQTDPRAQISPTCKIIQIIKFHAVEAKVEVEY